METRHLVIYAVFALCLAAARGQVVPAFGVPANLSALERQPFEYPYVPPMQGPVQGPRSKVQGLGSVEHALLVERPAAVTADQVIGVAVPAVVLSWDPQPGVGIWEIWHSSNLVNWNILCCSMTDSIAIPETNIFVTQAWALSLATNADQSITTNVVAVPYTNNADFYKVRAMDVNFTFEQSDSNWPYSAWGTK